MHTRVHFSELRDLPRSIQAFSVLALLDYSAWLIFNSEYVSQHVAWTTLWFGLGLGLLAALVIWRQVWAWWLAVLMPILYLLSPAWGARFHPYSDIFELVFLGLALMPSMRRHLVSNEPVTVASGARRRPSAWWLALCVSALFVLVIELEGRHHASGSVAIQVIGTVGAWLLFAAAIRLLLLFASWGMRLVQRGMPN